MDCRESRRLLDEGVIPGSASPLRARLGFHLAACPACQAYHRLSDDGEAPEAPQPLPPGETEPGEPAEPAGRDASDDIPPPSPSPRRLPFRVPRLVWIIALVVLVGVPLGGGVWLVGVLVRAHHHVSAMIVPTLPPTHPAPGLLAVDATAPKPASRTATKTATKTIRQFLFALEPLPTRPASPTSPRSPLPSLWPSPTAPPDATAPPMPTTLLPTPTTSPLPSPTVVSSSLPLPSPSLTTTTPIDTPTSIPSPVPSPTPRRVPTRLSQPAPPPTYQPPPALPTAALRLAAPEQPVPWPASPPLAPPQPTPWQTVQSLSLEELTAWPTIETLPPVGGADGSAPSSVGEASGSAASAASAASSSAALQEAPPAGDAITLLFLGTDRRPGEAAPPRTDAIMLARVAPQQQRIALLSLPRDLWATIPGYGASRINAAYVWGELYQAPGGGMGLAKETISTLLNIPIDYVTVVDFEGFIGLIDTLGGVTVEVEKELHDPTFPTMDYGYTVAHFLPGPQKMDGETALTYSRIRHPDSDFMRTLRQQAVLTAIGARLRERGDLTNVATIDQITGSLSGYVQTTIPEDRMVGLLWALRDVRVEEVEHYSMTSDMVSWGVGGDRYALVASPSVLADLARKLMGQVGTE